MSLIILKFKWIRERDKPSLKKVIENSRNFLGKRSSRRPEKTEFTFKIFAISEVNPSGVCATNIPRVVINSVSL
jgi:hypothetical protein